VLEALGKNPYYAISKNPGHADRLFAAAKIWEINENAKSMPKQIAEKVGDMDLWKRLVAIDVWQEVRQKMDPNNQTKTFYKPQETVYIIPNEYGDGHDGCFIHSVQLTIVLKQKSPNKQM
jgi:hypothetical protein